MIREWREKDIQAIVTVLEKLRTQSIFGQYRESQSSVKEMTLWVKTLFDDPTLTIHLKVDDQERIIGMCGGKLTESFFPPHATVVSEWCWWGHSKRDMVDVWKSIKTWAKKKGITFAMKTHMPTVYTEKIRWEKLT